MFSILHFGYFNPSQLHKPDRDPIPAKNIEKALGVVLSIDLKLTIHVTSADKKKAEFVLALLKRSIFGPDKIVYLKLYKKVVRPHLEYAIATWNPYLKRNIRLIEKVQKRASKCIHGLQHLSHDQRLAQSNLDSLEKSIHIADLTKYFKTVNNISISNHSNIFLLQIIPVLVVITVKFRKIFTFELQK